MTSDLRRSVRQWAVAGLAGLAGFLIFHIWVPHPGVAHSVCLFRRATGVPCPGCGMTRAFGHMAKGEWSAAAADHPLAYPLAIEMFLFWAWWGAALAKRRPEWMPRRYEAWMLGHAVVLTAFWLGRAATGALPW